VKEEFESHKSDLYFLSGSELTELENDFVEFATESYDENTIQKESGLVVHTYYVVEGRVAKFIGYNNHSGFQFNDKTGWFAHKEIPAGIELSETQNF
jgi:hypothetical protein